MKRNKENSMENCVLCQLHLVPSQNIILENEHCLFLQLTESQQQDISLAGAGIIVQKPDLN